MKPTQLLSVLFVLIFLHATTISAQQFMWGVRGGSPSDDAGTYTDERVYDMTTDANGNVYALSAITASSSTYLGAALLPTYSSPAAHSVNLLVTSYSCNGTLRWKKLIGGDVNCTAQAIRTDSQGHVYVMGLVDNVSTNPGSPLVRVHFDADTILPYDLNKRIFIAQYDTTGTYKWLRMPQSDTASVNTYYKSLSFDMAVDNSGNLNVVTFLTPGSLPGTNYTVSTSGLYILKYNPQGTLLSAVQPQGFNFSTITTGSLSGYANVAFESFRLAQSANGNWIISGSQSPYAGVLGFTINGQLVNHPGFVAGFNSQWQHLWHHITSEDVTRFKERPVTDTANNIYISGGVSDGYVIFGDTVHVNSPGYVPFVVKLNSNGAKIWLSHASKNEISTGGCHAISDAQAVTLASGGDVMVTGGCVGLTWGNVQIPGRCNTNYNTFVARLNSIDGNALDIDTIPVGGNGNFTPGGNFGMSIAAGKNNNVYLGGKMTYSQVAGTSAMNFIGGNMDLFIAKYGYNCNCVMPTAAFSKSNAGNIFTFTYNGTTTAIDSVVWNFGDGQTLTRTGAAMTTPVVHTFTANGNYTICVTAYGACGNHQTCQSIQTAGGTGIAARGLPEGVKIYPNPAEGYLIVEGTASGHVRINNILGQQVYSATIKKDMQQIATEHLPAGNYVVTITLASGLKGNIMITKR